MKLTKNDWLTHVEAHAKSGLSASAYCRKAELKYDSFLYHKRRETAQNSEMGCGQNFRRISIGIDFTVSVDPGGAVSLHGIDPDLLPGILRACSDAVS